MTDTAFILMYLGSWFFTSFMILFFELTEDDDFIIATALGMFWFITFPFFMMVLIIRTIWNFFNG